MAFSEKKYETLKHFKKKHQLCDDDIRYAVDNNHLKISIKLRSAYYVEKLACKDQEPLKGKDGGLFEEEFIGVRPEDVWTILKKGRAKLRKFTSTEQDGPLFRLAEEPPQPSILVYREDLIVFKKHEEEFKAVWKTNEAILKTRNGEPILFEASEDYCYIIFKGEEYYFGPIQGKIIKILHEAALANKPLMHKKDILFKSESGSDTLQDAFKHKPGWRKLIVQKGKGRYKLNLPQNHN